MEITPRILLLSSLALEMWALTPDPPQENVCFLVTDPDAFDLHQIWTAVDNKLLYDRKGTHNPLPQCSTAPPPGPGSCMACVREKEVMAEVMGEVKGEVMGEVMGEVKGEVMGECLLSDPSSRLNFEANWTGVELKKTQTPCGPRSAPAPAVAPGPRSAPAPAVTPGPPSAEGPAVGVVVAVVIVVIALFAVGIGVFVWKKTPWRPFCAAV